MADEIEIGTEAAGVVATSTGNEGGEREARRDRPLFFVVFYLCYLFIYL